MLGGASNYLKAAQILGVRYPAYSQVLKVESITLLGFAAFSIYSGVLLLLKKRNAVKRTQLFLVSYFVFHVLCLVAVHGFDLTPEAGVRFEAIFGRTMLYSAIYTVIWYLYLSKSIRVQNTYSL